MIPGDSCGDALQFWRVVELFAPQPVPAVSAAGSDGTVLEWNPKQALPWRSRRAAAPNSAWEHTVYLGLYELSAVYQSLRQAFREDPGTDASLPAGRSACAALVVDEFGCLIPGSAVLSSCAWAVGRIHRSPRRHDVWFTEYDQARVSFAEQLQAAEDRRSKLAGSPAPVPLGTRSLEEIRGIAESLAGLDRVPELSRSAVLIHTRQTGPLTAPKPQRREFLNSVHLEDLGRVAEAERAGRLGAGLRRYLAPIVHADARQRSDARESPDAVRAQRISLGRWPSEPNRSLTLSQQSSLAGALHPAPDGAGFFTVQQTSGAVEPILVREIIAHNVVERARRLAELDTTGDAFDSEHGWAVDGTPRRLPTLKQELTGYEMILATANEAAAKTLTAAISAAEAVAQPWAGHVEHFTGLASRIRQDLSRGVDSPSGGRGHGGSEEAWALLCAPLGDNASRTDFMDSFWAGQKNADQSSDAAGLEQQLKAPQPRRWKECVAEFQSSLERAQASQAERVDAEDRRRALPETAATLAEVSAEVDVAAHARLALGEELAAHRKSETTAEAELVRLREAAQRQREAKPGWWDAFVSLGRARREWRPGLAASEAALQEAEQRLAQTCQVGSDLVSEQSRAEGRERMAQADHARILARHAHLTEQVAEDRARYGAAYPGERRVVAGHDPVAAWEDREFNTARSELFVAALALHRAFIHDQGIRIRRGFLAAREVILDECPKDLDPEARLAAWQLLFLLVPVVSTTLSDLPQLFEGLTTESFGWLIIDGAGQCPAQHAVGGIWRARRTVAVGGTGQLAPALPVPPKALRAIAASFGVTGQASAPRTSVQALAERTR